MDNYLVIDLDKCFECEKAVEEMHHVVPQVRGGERTIPLCSGCHGKAHGISNREGHSKLTKEGLAKAKARGVKLGNPQNLTKEVAQRAAMKRKLEAAEANKEAADLIIKFKNEGLNYVEIAKILDNKGIRTSIGGKFTNSTTSRLYRRVIDA